MTAAPGGPGQMTIRPAAAADAAALSALIVTTLHASNAADYAPEIIARVVDGFSPPYVEAMIARRSVLVACIDLRIIGTAALDAAAVRSVFVAPEAQGGGVGTALMAEIARLAATSGVRTLRLQSSLTARGFYLRLGFCALGEACHGDERTVVMELDLASRLASGDRL